MISSSLDTDQATCAYFWDLVKNNNKYYIDFLGSQISRRSFPSHPNLLYIHKSLSVKILCQIFHTIFIKSVFKFFRISYCLLSPSCLAGRGRRTPCSLGIRVFNKQCPKSLVLSNLYEDSTTSDLSPLGMKNKL